MYLYILKKEKICDIDCCEARGEHQVYVVDTWS